METLVVTKELWIYGGAVGVRHEVSIAVLVDEQSIGSVEAGHRRGHVALRGDSGDLTEDILVVEDAGGVCDHLEAAHLSILPLQYLPRDPHQDVVGQVLMHGQGAQSLQFRTILIHHIVIFRSGALKILKF